eukprot:CAMPEP_0194134120 /NCGR_PEP_ID=MMETSP0152-20130528/4180_1 /TAXON_ID=1049557 /ORGANISM="Thalassiothrix antarctica, Strain L6-D1" /LENGTH=846 /DNA_ID=CAMNT_0038829679 /DNA_START=142 /DNA_END=2682 /DNA_ORIENTATION=-
MLIEDDSESFSKGNLDENASASEEIVESDLIGLGEMRDGGNIGSLKTPPLQPSQVPSPVAASWGTGVVPQYNEQNRILMRSPLPSPTQTVRKKIVKPHVTDDYDSEDEEKQKKREEAHISRLVHMAKAQQNLMTAWFAASAGAEEVTIPVPPRRKSRRKPTKVPTNDPSAPIDIDSGAQWDEEISSTRGSSHDDVISVSSTRSNTSGKMRAFVSSVLGVSNTHGIGSTNIPSTMTGVTLHVNNLSPGDKIEKFNREPECYEHGGFIFCCGKAWSRNRIILALLVAIFGVAFLTIFISTGGEGGNNAKEDKREYRDDDFSINPPLMLELPTKFPTAFPSVPPSGSPSFLYPSDFPSESFVPTTPSPSSLPTTMPSRSPSQLPSSQPSLRPSPLPSVPPTLTPSSTPSVSSSWTPSLNPTSDPSNVPSCMPSISQIPSLIPSSSPSTIFSTTMFNRMGAIISGRQDKEQFGYGVAMDSAGRTVAIGARNFESNKNVKTGRVIVYEQNKVGTWAQKGQELIGRNDLDQFGWSVALSGDGCVLAVSEPSFDTDAGNRSGNIRVFSWEETKQKWSPLGNEIPGEGIANLFGFCLSLSKDGSRLVAGAPYMTPQFDRQSGRVRVFELKEGSWQLLGQALDGSNSVDWFGWSVDISDDGNSIAVGAPRNRIHGGYVRIFNLRFANGEPLWIRSGRDISNELLDINSQDRFGMSVSLDGNKVAIGSPWKDADGKNNVGLVAVYKLIDDNWELMGSPIVGENELGYVGSSICLKGDYLTIGAHGAREAIGKVSFHRYDGNDWDVSSFPLLGSSEDEEFGYFVAANQDSTRVLVGAPARKHPDSLPGSFQVFSRKA